MIIKIAHRGNINGREESNENNPSYILHAINEGFDAEVDVWYIKNNLYLGHDEPCHQIDLSFILNPNLWIHCKSIEAMEYLSDKGLNAFLHKDDIVITPNGFLWTAPGFPITRRSIAVMPETIELWDISMACGVCTDFINFYGYRISNNNL